jgi:hypothetical protein
MCSSVSVILFVACVTCHNFKLHELLDLLYVRCRKKIEVDIPRVNPCCSFSNRKREEKRREKRREGRREEKREEKRGEERGEERRIERGEENEKRRRIKGEEKKKGEVETRDGSTCKLCCTHTMQLLGHFLSPTHQSYQI